MSPSAPTPGHPAGSDGPALNRVGGGRSARISLVVGLALFGALLWLATLGQADEPSVPLPTRPAEAVALPPSVAPATPLTTATATPSALPSPSGGYFEALMQGAGAPTERVRLVGTADHEHTARLDLPPATWADMPRLAIDWIDARPAAPRTRVALVQLSLGDSRQIGLPAPLGEGRVVLPVEADGSRGWTYQVELDRAHQFSDPDELIVVVRLSPARHTHLEAEFVAGDRPVATITMHRSSGGYSGSLSVTGRAHPRPSAVRVILLAASGEGVVFRAALDWGHPRGPTLPLELAAGQIRLSQSIDGVGRWQYRVVLQDSRMDGFDLAIELHPAFP